MWFVWCGLALLAIQFLDLRIKEATCNIFRELKELKFNFLFKYKFIKIISKDSSTQITINLKNNLQFVYNNYKMHPGHWREEVYLCKELECGRIDNKLTFLYWSLVLTKEMRNYKKKKEKLTRRW